MIKKLSVLLLLLFYTTILHASEATILEKVESSARSWLELVDAGKFKQSWENAQPLFKAKTSESQWLKFIDPIRTPRGGITARYIATAASADSWSDYPDGEYVVLQFYTTFVKKGLAMETVILAKNQDGAWQFLEYSIK